MLQLVEHAERDGPNIGSFNVLKLKQYTGHANLVFDFNVPPEQQYDVC